MWNSSDSLSSSSSSSSSSSVRTSPPPNIMSKFMEYYYRQPTCTYYTYYDFLVVIDFEATCDDNTRNENPRPIRHERPEIIQFPAILVNVRTMEIVSIFNHIVKPVEAPVLSKFCTGLTGITQSKVNKASTFPAVLRRFEEWLRYHGLALNNQEYGASFAIVTDGSYDMGHFLYKQCIISQIPYPSYATRWVNIRTIFTKVCRRRWGCLKAALEFFELPFEGRPHNGLDDSKNICKVLMKFLRYGHIVYQTEKILLKPLEQERNETRILNDKSAGKYDLATVAPLSPKEFEHFCLYSTDPWSTPLQRCVPPEVDPDYQPESFESSNGSMGMMSQQQPATSGSCESIASGCSNKENSIPMYIPNSKGAPGSKSRGSAGASSKDVICVSAAGVGTMVVNSNNGGGRHAGRRKKRNGQFKDSSSNGNGAGGSVGSVSGGSDCMTSGEEGDAPTKVASDSNMNASSSEVSHHSHHLQSKPLDSDGTSTTHLQPLVSDLRTEE